MNRLQENVLPEQSVFNYPDTWIKLRLSAGVFWGFQLTVYHHGLTTGPLHLGPFWEEKT